MNLKIRHAKKEDIDELAQVMVDSYKNNPELGENWNLISAKKLIAEFYFARQPDMCFVAEMDNKIVGGFVSEIKPFINTNDINGGDIFVDPKFQNKNIGKLLILKAFEFAKKKYNATDWDLITFKHTDFPQNWYKTMGFYEPETIKLLQGKVDDVIENIKKKL